MQKVLYILIRADLPPAVQGVQAGHAVAEWCKTWQYAGATERLGWDNDTLIYVTVPDLKWLMLWSTKIEHSTAKDKDPAVFREPDINNEATAIACLVRKDNKLFAKLPLWKP